jgi:hypothetical protein
VAAPLDVIKTRIQNRDFNNSESGFKILRRLVAEEGFGAFFKGLTPKVGFCGASLDIAHAGHWQILVVGPKLVFSMTVASQMIAYFERVL